MKVLGDDLSTRTGRKFGKYVFIVHRESIAKKSVFSGTHGGMVFVLLFISSAR